MSENKEIFCKKYYFQYLKCLTLSFEIFGKENGKNMCNDIKEILDYSVCEELNYNYINELIENHVKNLQSQTQKI